MVDFSALACILVAFGQIIKHSLKAYQSTIDSPSKDQNIVHEEELCEPDNIRDLDTGDIVFHNSFFDKQAQPLDNQDPGCRGHPWRNPQEFLKKFEGDLFTKTKKLAEVMQPMIELADSKLKPI